jgi:drug/metabolite transporter (DMT)-like permease
VGAVGFFLALAFVPLSTASAILQALPLIVTMGAALILGESVGWRRWTAVCVGFAGVLLIIRPSADDFNPYALLALLAAFGLGFRDLLNRRLPRDIRTLQLTTWGFGMIVLAGALLMPFGGPARMPSPLGFGLLGMVFVLSGLAYYAITASTRLADASVVAPFRYTRLLFALLLGAAVFGERPDAAMLLGAALIIGSGLYALVRGQRQGGA